MARSLLRELIDAMVMCGCHGADQVVLLPSKPWACPSFTSYVQQLVTISSAWRGWKECNIV